MANLFANSDDPDQTPRSAASNLAPHYMPSTLLRVSRLQWVNATLSLGFGFNLFHLNPVIQDRHKSQTTLNAPQCVLDLRGKGFAYCTQHSCGVNVCQIILKFQNPFQITITT